MHLIVARRDLTGFQHLHPTQGADGAWSANVRLDDPGSYRMFADFSHEETPRTLAADLRVDGAADLRPLPAPSTTATSDGGYDVRLDGRRRRPALRHHARRQAGEDRALPRRRRPPRRAARGRPGLPARPPHRRRAELRRRVPDPRAATGCSSSSSTRGACRPPRSRGRWRDGAPRPAHHRDDLRVVREPDRAQAQQARRRQRVGQLRDRDGDRRLRGRRRAGRARRRRRGGRLPGRAAGRRARGARRGGRAGAAAPPPDRLRAAVGAGAADRDDPGAAVRQLAVAVAPAGHAGRAVGRVAVPPRRLGEPQARRGDDGHADLGRRPGRVGLVAVRALPRRRRRCRTCG